MPVEDFWPEFGDSGSFREESCDERGSLAEYVLNYYDIRCNSNIGGSLEDMDIKHMDAWRVVKLSLLQASAEDRRIYEPVMQPDGSVDFKAVGSYTGLSGADVYYELQTGYYREDCSGVMVTGGTPLSYRKDVNWKPVWQGGPKDIYNTGIMHSSCLDGEFNQYCVIVYNDPHLDSRYEDGIDNLYEITKDNPWDRIIGYAYYMDFPGSLDDPDLAIEPQNNAKIVVPVAEDTYPVELGTLRNRPAYSDQENEDCYDGQGEYVTFGGGVEINIPDNLRYETVRNTRVDKFLGVAEVYIIGRRVNDLRSEPISPEAGLKRDGITEGEVQRVISIDDSYDEVFRLEKGKHYVINYSDESTDKRAEVAFSNNSRILDPANWGTGVSAYLSRDCAYYLEAGQNEEFYGSILPTSDTGGIWVKEIWAAVDLDTPSINIFHPNGKEQKAREIAENLEYQITPLVVVEEPAPIAFNGREIDQTQNLPDHDPTTAQDFEDTDLEKAMDEMDKGGGLSITCSFLDIDGCEKLSDALYDYMNSGSNTEATYICGPGASAELGGRGPNGGIVNSITYSYQDSNSYTISVNTGQTLMGDFAQVDAGLQFKRAEDVPAHGTVIEDQGNHIYFKVRLDGVGDRIAINMQPDVLRVGDTVNCTIHNNPVEV